MSPADLRALADRVESAERGSQELDAHILAALVGGTVEQSPINMRWCVYDGTDRNGRPRLWEARSDLHSRWRNAAFTTSLDAAVTLVPQGWSWSVTKPDYDRPFAEVGPRGDVGELGDAATPALALCAAALRARAAEMEPRDE